jgi:hypothetical protein
MDGFMLALGGRMTRYKTCAAGDVRISSITVVVDVPPFRP